MCNVDPEGVGGRKKKIEKLGGRGVFIFFQWLKAGRNWGGGRVLTEREGT
jgi:hypothetical protein